jgi:hypothetical protein
VLDSGRSAFAPLALENIVATTGAGAPVATVFARDGQLVLIEGHPLLQANLSTNGNAPQLTLYGNPGTNYFIQYTASLAPPAAWIPFTNFILTGLQTNFNPVAPADPMEFFQAYYFGPPPP